MGNIFLTELMFEGTIESSYKNMRTEFAWMYALDAQHKNIFDFDSVVGYDNVFLIVPKGHTFLNAAGSKLVEGAKNPISDLLKTPIVDILKRNGNRKIHYIQEGPAWWWNEYEIEDQLYFYNFLYSCDSIFTHNEYEINYYKGIFPNKEIRPIGTLMIDDLLKDIVPIKNDKTIIGGNFARWYGGFESYIVAQEFGTPIWAQTSHAKRENEEHVENLNHLPRLIWSDWMQELSTYKYAVHLMPTIAAGTFSLNCAYFGIPCIGNEKVDTQLLCHPDLSVDVSDIQSARKLANKLKTDNDFYMHCSEISKQNYEKYYSVEVWKSRINNLL